MIIVKVLFVALFSFGFLTPKDEVKKAQDSGTFSQEDYKTLKEGATEDYFSRMDKGVTLPKGERRSDGQEFSESQEVLLDRLRPLFPEMSDKEIVQRAIQGRNNWMVYTGGNDKFWDHFNKFAFGGIDLLKTISNHPEASVTRSERWEKLGLVNEPCFEETSGPRKDRYGLWLDQRPADCQPDPFESAEKYPGVEVGARGDDLYVGVGRPPAHLSNREPLVQQWYKNQARKMGIEKTRHEVGSSYGYATGILGLRLFTNPDFDQEAASRWDAERYYKDPSYFNDPNLIKPYRVGMACAFCHVGPNPENPPQDFNNPKWENLSSTVGSQYFWVDRVLFWNYKKNQNNFIHQLLHTQRPGTLDTSLVSSDQINNPRTMNAVYEMRARVKAALDFGHTERLKDEERLNNKLFSEDMVSSSSPLQALKGENISYAEFKDTRDIEYVTVPRILKDGADSASALGSLNRVYVNIGLYSEEWVKNFVPLLGDFNIPFFKITPFEIKKAQKNSGYWNANVKQTPNLALFLLGAGSKDELSEAPQGETYLKGYNSDVVNLGKKVFAKECASCHSSKLPEKAYSFFKKKSCLGAGYKKCWNDYWNFTNSNSQYHQDLEEIVKEDAFLEDNFLSTDLRVPVNVVESQVCTSVATNAIEDDIWDNFSSDSYKELPAIQQASVYEPSQDNTSYVERKISLPGGGRGYIRPPSLVSIWSTAPFLNNNSLGPFNYQGTIEKRMESYTTSMKWLLNPEMRGRSKAYDVGEKVVEYEHNGHKAQGVVDVLQVDSYVSIPEAYIPSVLFRLLPDKWKDLQENYSYKDASYLPNRNARLNRSLDNFVPFNNNNSSDDFFSRYTNDQADYVTDYESEENRLLIGPIPKGVPVNLISNMNLETSKLKLIEAIFSLAEALEASSDIEDEEEKLDVFMNIARKPLLNVSKCRDFIVNKGHYFGTKFEYPGAQGLSPKEKEALVEFLKYF